MKRCSTSLINREMQIQTTLRYPLTLVRMAVTHKSTNSKCWIGCGVKGTLSRCWWECNQVQPLPRRVWRLLKKLKIELPYDPGIPLLGMHTEDTRIESLYNATLKKIMTTRDSWPFDVSVSCCCVTSYPQTSELTQQGFVLTPIQPQVASGQANSSKVAGGRGESLLPPAAPARWLLAKGELWSLYVFHVVVGLKVQC